jgi:hypothetical protein
MVGSTVWIDPCAALCPAQADKKLVGRYTLEPGQYDSSSEVYSR